MQFKAKLERIKGRQVLNFPEELEIQWKTMLVRREEDGSLTLLPGKRKDREAMKNRPHDKSAGLNSA